MAIDELKIELTDTNFGEVVLKSELPCLVDFWAGWCAPCLMVAPIIDELAKEYKGRLKVCKLNVDEAPDTASKYGIMGIPTLAIFKNGEIADKIVGVVSKAELETAIKPHI
ncbi:MAG: thioredoxin [Candidatus Omnitrophota bacterium]|nr:thioredoxin [Candidatus Omnitrophota bacterium]